MEQNAEEYQYINLIKNVLENGSCESGRNGNTISLFGASMRFSLQNNTIPILTTKRTAWKTCFKELMWFIRGQTNNRILTEQGVHIWDANSTKEFLESRGLDYEEGELGPIYGFQWRNFNGNYHYTPSASEHATSPSAPTTPTSQSTEKNAPTKQTDQLQYIIEQLKNPETRTSRRLVMSAWNPCQLDKMALPPCHILCQFNVHDGNKLSCSMYQRSGDIGLGVPFNIASYSFLTHLIAKHCDLIPYEFVYFLGNAHIYDDHIEQLKTQICRPPFPFPTIRIAEKRNAIEEYSLEDIQIDNYVCHEKISMNMRA
jgi:thymidylate synthase